MEKLKKIISNNLGWKILSLLISIFVWFVGMNINNPVMTETFSLPLELRNVYTLDDSKLILLNKEELENETVDIKVRGNRNDLQELKRNQSKMATPYIDFSPVDISSEKNVGTKFSITVHKPNLGSKYEVLDNYPRTVDIVLDKEVYIEKPIEIQTKGTLGDGYITAGNISVEPKSVIINGASTIVDDIARVLVNIDISNKEESFSSDEELIVFNTMGEDITQQLNLSVKNALVNVNILRSKKIPVEKAEIVGELPEHFVLGDVSYSQEYLEVVGEKNDVEVVESIFIEPIDIEGKTEDFVVSHNLERIVKDVNENISVRNGTPKTLKINVEIREFVSKTFSVPTENLNIKGIKDEMVLAPTFNVVVYGLREDIENFDVSTIDDTLDLRNFDESKGIAYIDIELEEGLTIENTPYVYIEIVDVDMSQSGENSTENNSTENE